MYTYENPLKKFRKKFRFLPVFLFALLLFLTRFSTYAPEAGASATLSKTDTSSDAEIINIVLSEWSILLDKTSIQAGRVRFSVKNEGPADRHEFVVFKTDLAPEALPATSKGVDENGKGLTLIGEIEGIVVGAEPKQASFELAPGNYVLICNVWDESEQESHYHEGMRVKFTVS